MTVSVSVHLSEMEDNAVFTKYDARGVYIVESWFVLVRHTAPGWGKFHRGGVSW